VQNQCVSVQLVFESIAKSMCFGTVTQHKKLMFKK